MVSSPCVMMLPPNIPAVAQAAYRNISRARSGFTDTGVPLMCHTAAPFGHASTHAPHFMHDSSVSPFLIDSSLSDIVGQLFWHSTQGEQTVRSILMSNTLVLLKIDWNAPNGQRNVHCVRFFVSRGSTITSAPNSTTKIPFCTNPTVLRAATYSDTALNGHSHMQYAGSNSASESSTIASSTAQGTSLYRGSSFFHCAFLGSAAIPSSIPPKKHA